MFLLFFVGVDNVCAGYGLPMLFEKRTDSGTNDADGQNSGVDKGAQNDVLGMEY